MMRNGGGFRGMERGSCFWSSTPKSGRCVRFPTRSLSFSDEFAVLGLTPFASKTDVKHAYKRLALKYHPDVIKGDNVHKKEEIFKEIKSAYENLMDKLEVEEELRESYGCDEHDEWDEWMGFEGGIPVIYNPS